MTSIKPFQIEDLLDVNPVNLDPLTESYNVQFYLEYLLRWPTLVFKSTEISEFSDAPDGSAKSEISGYMMGKTEGLLDRKEWHTHITAVSVNSYYRRLGLASHLCSELERLTSGPPFDTLFVDLFVRVTNTLAQQLYEKLGYSVFRRVVGYYGRTLPEDRDALDDSIDAFDMRKLLPRDARGETVRTDGRSHYVLPTEIVF